MLYRIIPLIAAAMMLPAPAPGVRTPVKVTGGLLSGVPGRDASITAFKGIPYAAPPVGELRWKPPAPVVPWQGVRKADAFGASCVQIMPAKNDPWTYEFMTHNETSEDCLSVNVWTPASSARERRPVFVYVYGGAFSQGSGAVPLYDGEGLARKGLVVVTFNYRVGVFGFLAHPELSKESPHHASGNYGLLDQVAALRWVRENITAFGGDPDRVTIAGQSAGAISVHALIASPLARGLFHRAIIQSGGSNVGGGGIALGLGSLANAEAAGQKFAAAKGAPSLAALRALSAQALLDPVKDAPAFRFSPVVDGHLLPAPIPQIIKEGKQNDVPTLTGVNAGELRGLAGPAGPVGAAALALRVRQQYGAQADEFLALYPADTDERAAAAQAESARDQALVSMYLWARERARTSKTRAYLYLWDHPLPGPDAARYGAFHSSELAYVLNTLYMSDRPFQDADRRIADMMSSYWSRFAANGDPNGDGLPRWEPYGEARQVMEVGDRTEPLPVAGTPARFAFHETFLMRPRAGTQWAGGQV